MHWTRYEHGDGIRVNHIAIIPHNLETSLKFYVEGLGLEVLVDVHMDGPFRHMFDAPEDCLRAILLGDKHRPDEGRVELIAFPEGDKMKPSVSNGPSAFFLVSFMVDVAATSERLRKIGVGTDVRVVDRGGRLLGSVRDPDGILVELIEASLNGA